MRYKIDNNWRIAATLFLNYLFLYKLFLLNKQKHLNFFFLSNFNTLFWMESGRRIQLVMNLFINIIGGSYQQLFILVKICVKFNINSNKKRF